MKCCHYSFCLTISLILFFISKIFAFSQNGELLTLDQAIQIALENNPSLKSAQYGLKASGLNVKYARRNLLPQADLHFSYSRLDPGTVRRGNVFVEVGRTLVKNFNAGDPNDIRPGAYDNNFATSFQIIQPLYNGGANWASVSLARAQEWAQEYELENTRQEIILAVKTRYLRALQAQELVTLARQSLKSTEQHLRTTRQMLEVGLRSKTDVLRWEVQKAADEGKLVEAQNNLEIALASLKEAMGIPFDKKIALKPLHFKPVPLNEKLEDQIKLLQANHPQLKKFEATLDAKRVGVRLASAGIQPKINFVYELGWERNNTLALDSFAFWSATVAVNIPIFHGFSNLAKIQQAKVEEKQLQEQKQVLERVLILQLIQARLKVNSALKRFQIARKGVEQAQENLNVINNSFEVGLATNIDVLDAQVALNQAKTNLINAQYDYWIARAELDRALGVVP
ncbi:MAG: TolC family protein [Calditrichaeota bacterium]|nr:MAG: TolC family protein [Calditrichota bacterium]